MFSDNYFISTNIDFINKKITINVYYYTTILLINSFLFSGLLIFTAIVNTTILYLHYIILLMIIFNIVFTLSVSILILDHLSKNIFLKDEAILFKITTTINYFIIFCIPLLIILNNLDDKTFIIISVVLLIVTFILTIIVIIKVSSKYNFIDVKPSNENSKSNKIMIKNNIMI